ncbi:Hypothetical predicted protein [Mytilus galloprovincialis]|uniref:Uncharacterized protein n=1 Tax=Mytilus galloprovincialis TaxID=29158 RepID=A0A8B6FCL3_MYTGA|nr:Hypothetical predicted protein [Mytilus galloprovincialis]
MKNFSITCLLVLFSFIVLSSATSWRPDSNYKPCNSNSGPVCGTNGKDYFNECHAFYSNVKVGCNKKCPCDCAENCPATYYHPVCGVDGKEYKSKCHADCKNVKVGCNKKCPCDCADDCPATYYHPVCGVDGKQYKSKCHADCKNVKIGCNKQCPCDCTDGCHGSYYHPVCGVDGKTYKSKCHLDCKKVSECPKIKRPVCGVDRKTYDTKCDAKCAGTTVQCAGECPCDPCSHCKEGGPKVCGPYGKTYTNECFAKCSGKRYFPCKNTNLVPSIFPLLFKEDFVFEKTYYTALDPSDISDYLEGIPNSLNLNHVLYIVSQGIHSREARSGETRASKLVELAEEAELQKIPAFEPDNYIFANKIRRTVDGVELPHPKTVIDWSDDLNTIPIIEAFDVNHYLKNICNWTNERLKGYKNDNSYRLHSNGHIRDVRQSKFHSDIHYVKAACVPEERQSADPYEVWIVVLFDGSIHSAECTCVAGDGTCKHVAALLFGMQRFCQDLSDRSVISVTDKAAKWVNPVRTSAPVKITSLDLRSEPTGQPPIKPTSDHYRPSCHNMTPHAVEKEMLRLIKSENLPACAAYVLSDSSGSEYDFECLPVNILDLATQFNNDDSSDDSLESFIEHIHRNIPDNYFTDIFEKTVSQSDSDLWFYQRHGRITASILYSCLHFSGRNPDGHLVKLILGLTNSVNSDLPALRHGKKFEHVARESYLHDKKNLHDNLECKLSGFVIDNNSPYLGCSPDGLLECKCCGQGCLEIKCPYKFSEETPINAAACLDKTKLSHRK